MRVAIIGAGIVGLSLARELLRAGDMVSVVDPGLPGRGATWAAAGMLSPCAEARQPGPFFDFARAAAAFYPDFVRELEAETALGAGYRTEGTLVLYHTVEERAAREEIFGWQRRAGIALAHLDRDDVRLAEPAVNALGGYLLPGDFQVDNRRLAIALVQSCTALRAVFVPELATAVHEENGRATGLTLAGGGFLQADCIVNAAGAWAAQIEAPAVPLPVRPIKGHMLSLAVDKELFSHVLHDSTVYLVPRANGVVVVGSTMEDAGFDSAVHPGVIASLRAAAERLVPALEQAAVVETWTGFRPHLPGDLPRIGPTALPGYFVAAGHFRNGILLAPLTARLLAAVIHGAQPDPLLRPFLP